MDSSQILRLYSRSKLLLNLVKDSLLSAGGKKNASGEISFPLHNRSIDCNSDSSEHFWLPVQDSLVDHSSLECAGQSFDAATFFRFLDTELLGKSILFAERIPSTINILDRLTAVLPSEIGIVAIAGQQTSGLGRRGNVWESPLGCAMFSFPLTVPLSSKLGQGLSFVQHLVATACVLAVRNTAGYEAIDLRIKWPNDILTSEKVKVGGVLVSSSIFQGTACCNIGVGFNVTNAEPTTCLNDLIRNYNRTNKAELNPFTSEQFIARMLTELEKLLNSFSSLGSRAFLPIYLKYWLHMNQTISVQLDSTTTAEKRAGEIIGLDQDGFLQVKMADGGVWSVQSDGNRFDMMANLLLLRKIS